MQFDQGLTCVTSSIGPKEDLHRQVDCRPVVREPQCSGVCARQVRRGPRLRVIGRKPSIQSVANTIARDPHDSAKTPSRW